MRDYNEEEDEFQSDLDEWLDYQYEKWLLYQKQGSPVENVARTVLNILESSDNRDKRTAGVR